MITIRASVAVLLTVWVNSAQAQTVAEFYAGRQINMIVGSTPGGGYDTQGRLAVC
jgi:tripartite-type tricarboxylate transporter receptor subunit TctC